ncbi:MAG: M48 family metalloprotease [Opitutae bacterium]|nr:M48 family metalloprotease [Opitutae bacterium]
MAGKPAARLTAAIAPWLLFLAGCESTNIAPITGANAALEQDEQRLWLRADEEQSALERSGLRLDDRQLEAYLDSILDRLHPEPLLGGNHFHARVLVDPTLNAFALPTGVIYIHTGLLAHMGNEAQLATILGHELTHATHRHAVKGFRSVKNKSAFYATFAIGTGGVGSLIGAVGALAAVSGYSKDLEREADRVGFDRVIAAGYDPRESPKVFRAVLTEAKRTKLKEPFFFGSHPRLQERIDNFTEFVATLPASKLTGRIDAEPFNAAIQGALARNVAADLQAGDFDGARDGAQRYLARTPEVPEIEFLLAESHRKRNEPVATATARELYARLLARHPDFADAHRSLGIVLLKDGKKPEAAAAFRRYLELTPQAPDRAYIENFISQCETKS